MPRQAKYKSEARRGFNYLLLGVEGLLDLHQELHGKVGKPRRAVSDILRSTLVLALAALDGVVLEAVIEASPLAAKKGRGGSDLSKWIAAEPHLMLAGIAAGDASGSLAEVARANIGRTTSQKAEAIEGMLRGALGCETPWDLAAAALSEVRAENWTAEDVRTYLDDYAEPRNRIAHSGDREPSKRAATGIRYGYVRQAVDLVGAAGRAVCTVVEDRINSV